MCTPRSKYDKNHIIKNVQPKTHKTDHTERADHILKVFYLLPLPLPNRPNLASHWKNKNNHSCLLHQEFVLPNIYQEPLDVSSEKKVKTSYKPRTDKSLCRT